jgi:2-keto-4-pentenoate hydratase
VTCGLTSGEHRRLADLLRNAARERRTVAPLSSWNPQLTIGDGVRIRDMLIGRRTAEGSRLIGAKVSFGGAAAASGFRLPEPRVGWLTDDILLPSEVVDLGRLIRPRVEPRVAFVLARPPRRPFASPSDLLTATARILPCLEILDSRYDRKPLDAADDIADNCATAALLIGEGVAPPAEGHLRRLRVHVQADVAVDACHGPAAVVSPLETAGWLARLLIDEGHRLERGTLLVSPLGGAAIELAPRTRLTVHFGVLGSLELQAIGELPPPGATTRNGAGAWHPHESR